jgi:hypothetical protein
MILSLKHDLKMKFIFCIKFYYIFNENCEVNNVYLCLNQKQNLLLMIKVSRKLDKK